MKIKQCRICNSKSLRNLFSLGKMKFTGKFPKKNQRIPSGDVHLVMCIKCSLVQLKDNFNPIKDRLKAMSIDLFYKKFIHSKCVLVCPPCIGHNDEVESTISNTKKYKKRYGNKCISKLINDSYDPLSTGDYMFIKTLIDSVSEVKYFGGFAKESKERLRVIQKRYNYIHEENETDIK